MARFKGWQKIRKDINVVLDKTSVRQWLLVSVVALSIFGLLMFDYLPTGVTLEVGQVSRTDIVAPRTVINRPQTQRLQDDAARRAVREASEDPRNFDINHATVIKAEERLSGVLALLDDQRTDDSPQTAWQIREQALADYAVDLNVDLLEGVLAASDEEFDIFDGSARQIISEHMSTGISDGNLHQVRERAESMADQVPVSRLLQRTVSSLARQLIEPNLVLNTQKVEQARQEAIKDVEPVTILKGEIIVRKGDVVREEHLQSLQDLGLHRSGIDYLALLGLAIGVGMLMALLGVYIAKFEPDMLDNEGMLALIGLLLVVVAANTKILSLVQWSEAVFLAPTALAGMLLAILLDSRLAIVAAVVLSVVVALFSDFDIVAALVALSGGIVAVFSVNKVSQRGDLMRAGFVVGGVKFLLMVALGLLRGETGLVVHSYLGIVNGVFSSIVAIGSLPYLESAFGITSAIRLLELSNPNQPLLRRLLMETPGTYHHSILVGNLSEAAADAIRADGLLARVGASYHDIGKLKRPYFFVENQVGMDNPHDKMAATLSTLIITAHVRDGLELAREYKLPTAIQMFIAEHHGNDLVKFFYHRAKESGDGTVQEKDFRYPGPTPQTKETAIVSLADAVEAAVRSLTKPTPGKIEALVHRIIKDRLNDGQLDESELTFKDLDKIADAFVKVLMGIFHARVEYPETITREDIEGKRK